MLFYDLRCDSGERYDVKELYPAVVDDLKKLADEMRQDLGDENYSMPGVNSRKPELAEIFPAKK